MALTRLKAVRMRRGYTQWGFAQTIGCHPSSVSAVENRLRTSWPQFRQAACKVLNLPENELFESSGLAKLE